MSSAPLEGVRIVDLTTVVMGPLATRMLADMGADVIRVEGPEGDIIRDYEPMRSPKMSAFSMNLNRNKRSIVLDFKADEDRATLDLLIATADVVVTKMTAFRRETAATFGARRWPPGRIRRECFR